MNNGEKFFLSNKKQLISLLALLSSLIIISGYFYSANEVESARRQKQNELQAIAEIKIKQVSQWFVDELVDANTISHNTILVDFVKTHLADGQDESQLNKMLVEMKAEHNYSDIILTTPAGQILATTNKRITSIEPPVYDKIKKSIASNSAKSTDLFISGIFENEVMLGFVSPVNSGNKIESLILVFLFNAEKQVYPLIDKWPVPSETSEIILARVEKDKVLFLNKLRHIKNEPLNFRISLKKTNVAIIKAINGHSGILDGKDYRGADVFAYASPIPSTPWFLLTKIDKSELYGEMYSELTIIGIMIVLLIIITGAGLYFIYNNRQKTIYAELYRKERELWQSQEKFKVTIDSLGDGVITADITGKIQYINRMAETLTGWNIREAKGRKLSEVYSVKNEQTGLKENNIIEKVLKLGIVKELANHTLLVSKSGSEIPVMDTGAPIYDNDGSIIGLVLTFQDETEKRQHLNEIAESEKKFRSFLDNMMEGCQILGPDWRYKYINDAATVHNKRPKEELLGKKYADMWPGIEQTEVYSIINQCMKTGGEKVFENIFMFPNGSNGWFELKIKSIPEGISILSYDITSRKLAEMEQKKLSRAVIQSPVTFIIMDKKGTIEYANPKFLEITGYSAEEVNKKNVSILRADGKAEIYTELWSTLLSGNEWKGEIQRKKKNGELFWNQINTSPILNEAGEITNFIELGEDVTERKNMLNDLVAAKEKAEEINKIKTHFFANMSHELRTPFVGIMGYAEILSGMLTSPETRAMATGILDTSKRMKETLTKILNISRFEFNGIEVVLKKADVAQLIKSIFNQYAGTASSKFLNYKLNMKFEVLEIITDISLISEVLNNLISNAMIFTNRGGIEVFAERQVINSTDTLIIKVADSGIGIPKEKQDVVWEEFRQVSEGYTRKYQGTGLGLAIAKKYTGLLKGRIYFESEAGQGTTFTVELPIFE